MTLYHINGQSHLIAEIYQVVRKNRKIGLGPKTISILDENRDYLNKTISDPDKIIYGINTGFGSLCDVRISDDNLEKLQENLVVSHACGMGDEIPQDIAKLILLLKIINLSHGYSGVRLTLVQKLVDIYNAQIIPVIYEQGSLGASGDLAPLAHMSLVLLGLGEVYHHGAKKSSFQALSDAGIAAIKLKSKEGLALLNGTQFSLAYSIKIIYEAERLLNAANRISALSMEAYRCNISPYHHLLHDIRPHEGQKNVAATIYALLKDSPARNEALSSVQDPYSFRCVPQVHGATSAAIHHAKEIITTELNAVTDNPIVFHDEEEILSGGNFHAQPLALILDYLAIAIAELGSISERRVYQLINGDRGLPAFLTPNPGLNSGFMIAQYTAASIVSQSKQYCTPASIDSIVSSKGQEDHVSMAANAATKGYKVLANLKSLLGIELLTASQAMEFRRPMRTSESLESLMTEVREELPFLNHDVVMHEVMMIARQIIEKWVVEENY